MSALKWILGFCCLVIPTRSLGQTSQPALPQKFAEARLEPKSGSQASGTVTFTHKAKGIEVVAEVTGVKPGKHGIHIHESGDCSALDAKSAGDHFNPSDEQHAGPMALHRHVGDLGNIVVHKNGKGVLKLDIPQPESSTAWQGIIGKSVVLHDKADDLKTQPSGNSGNRIACGTIQAVHTGNAT